MKTKAYKLAVELGLQEQPVLEWLKANGYPNVRRADTIRADVAQAARKALGRAGGPRGRHGKGGRTPPQSRASRQGGGNRQNNNRQNGGARPTGGRSGGNRHTGGNRPVPTRGRGQGGGGKDGFKVSFADLLEAHLPSDITAGHRAVPDTLPATKAVRKPAASPARADTVKSRELELRVARAETERDRSRQQADVERARAEGYVRELQKLQAELEAARRNVAAIDALREENERLNLDRATLKQKLQVAHDERETLAQTCGELQEELDELRCSFEETQEALEESRQGSIDTSSVLGDLETARKREVAWRTRALELERAVQQGGDVTRLLRGHGLETFRQQVRVLQALLADEKAAVQVIKAIRQIDAPTIEKLIEKHLRRCCADPLCERVTRSTGRIPLRVEDDSTCDICAGDAEQRWFAHMVAECGLAGVRRLLVIGGDEAVHDRLRALSEGQPVDLRLVTSDEEAAPARAAGRVEGCDAMIRWSTWVVPAAVSEPYVQAALAADRPIVTVLGRRCSIVDFARATVNRLARNHVLRAV